MSIYSNDNISKIAKLTTRELPHLAKTAKITVRENNGVYSRFLDSDCINFKFLHSWLFIDLSEHHYTALTSKFNNF